MKILLNPVKVNDAENILSWVNDPDITQYFANLQNKISLEDEQKYIEKLIGSTTDKIWSIYVEKQCTNLICKTFGSDCKHLHYVGQCSINQIYWPSKNGRIFLVLKKEWQGLGYAKIILDTLIEKAKELELHKLWLIVRADNRRAQALYLKAGFSFEGLLKDEYKVNDTYFDMVRMGLILK